MKGIERVSFFNPSKRFSVINRTEEVLAGARLLEPFFWFFTTHGNPKDHALYVDQFASFYSVKLPKLDDLKERGFDVVKVELSAQNVPQTFFDMRSATSDFAEIPPQKAVCLYVNERYAGVYFKKSRVLVATDWTHDVRCVSVIKQILPELSKIFRRKSVRPPKPRIKLMFGADPEFELLRGGKVISASGIIDGGTGPRELIGRDGAGSQVEIRPAPGSVTKFVKNFRRGLVEFAREYREYSLSVQGDVYPLGGHIHLSVTPDKELVKVLDNWIGEKVIDLSGKARGDYKKLGAIETKPWGFEYRTPPASIFLKEKMLLSVLNVIKKIVKAYYSIDGVSLHPTDEEIMRLQLEKEWQTLNDFIKKYKLLDKDVLKQWGIRRYKPKPHVGIDFRDDWTSEIRSYVSSLLTESLKKSAKKLNTRGVYNIVLFGFKSERGMVCNFESAFFEKIDFDYNTSREEVAFGLPYSVRVAELSEELKRMWNMIVDEIIKALLKIK